MSSGLEYGKGRHLWEFWLHGDGSDWRADPHPWSALHKQLMEHAVIGGSLPITSVDGLTTNLYVAAFHHGPNSSEIAATAHIPVGKPRMDKGNTSAPRAANDDDVLFRSFTPDLEVQAGGDGRTVRGIAVPYGQTQQIDQYLTERFMRGAFDHQLPAIHRVGFYRGHSNQNGVLIGPMKAAQDDAAGLYGEWRVSKTPAGDEALELIKDGALSQLSIGFRSAKGGSREVAGVVERHKANLFEVAIVPEGAYGDGAVITGVRAAVDGTCPQCGHIESPEEPAVRSRFLAAQEILAGLRPVA